MAAATVVELPEFDNVRVPKKLKDAPQAGSMLTLGVRPEHFEPGGEVRIRTQIDVVEDLGGVAYAYARSAEESPLIIEQKNARGTTRGFGVHHRLRPGPRLPVRSGQRPAAPVAAGGLRASAASSPPAPEHSPRAFAETACAPIYCAGLEARWLRT